MNRIIITGGLGFLGRYVREKVIEKWPDANIIIADISRQRPPDLASGFDYMFLDVASYKDTNEIIKKNDIVFHLAGIVSYNKKDNELMDRINFEGTKNVCNVCNNNHAKLIYASSTSAVGIVDGSLSDEKIYPSRVAGTINHYSKTKLDAELYVEKFRNSLFFINANIAAILGDNIFLENAIKLHKSPIIPILDTYNTFVDVRDAADAIVFLAANAKRCQRYIVASYICKNRDYQEKIIRLLKRHPLKIILGKKKIVYLKKMANITERYFDFIDIGLTSDFLITADADKMFSNMKILKLGWKPRFSLDDTLEYYVNKITQHNPNLSTN